MEKKKSHIAGSALSGKDKRFGDHFVDYYNSSLSYGRKKRGRIRYLNWATELYGCLKEGTEGNYLQNPFDSRNEFKIDESLNQEVRKAVELLSSDERQFIELFYFEFKSYQEIAHIVKKKVYKLERIHHRALGKLRILLADFVKNRFELIVPQKTDCIICKSPFKSEMDELIKYKKEEETYARLIRIFKQKYGINVKTPQVIIGHKRKHMV